MAQSAPFDPDIAWDVISGLTHLPGATLPILHALQDRFGYVDAAALSVGAERVAFAIVREAAARGVSIELVRNGTRGMPWLELMEGNPYALIEGMAIAAVAVGATLGFVYIRSEYPLDYEAFAAVKGMLGHGGVVVFDDRVDLAEQAKFAMEFCAEESCGRCTPCRIGSTRGAEVIGKINVVTTDFSDWATNCPEYKVTAVQVRPTNQRSGWQDRYAALREETTRIAGPAAAAE